MASSGVWLVITICCLFVTVQGQDAGGLDLDSLINKVFTRPGENTSPSPPEQTPSPPPGVNLQPVDPKSNVPNPTDCVCVAYYLCSNGTVNTNGEGVIDIRLNDGPCGNQYLEVCCKPEDTVEQPITPPPTNIPKGCGYRRSMGTGFRIVGAKDGEAEFTEFNWMVAILREETVEGNPQKLNVYQCGGALIHPRAVLTAAHCVAGKNKSFKVRAGEWDTQHETELFPYQDRAVEAIEIHPQFYAGALLNDVAVMILKTPVDTADNIGFICLPPQDHIVQLGNQIGRGYATGWGKDEFGKKGKYQVILKKIDVPIVANAQCQEDLRKTRLGKYFKLHESFICAGGEPGKDTCKGDGGSPLVFPISGTEERYYQAGIVAWGIGCGENGTPGVYVNVAKFRNWIDDQMKRHNLETSVYEY